MAKRILTGIQSSNTPHLGNILGGIRPAIKLAKEHVTRTSFFFIADLHSLTTQKEPDRVRTFAYATAAAWLACGVDPELHILYRQSRVPAVCELAWYFNCFTPYPMLANAHAFKEKRGRLADVNVGLFTYPVLMAADILLYQATHVPVGKDQKQHLEIARGIARSFNRLYGSLFTIPEAMVATDIAMVPGTDGRKMSKSYQNTIDIFAPIPALKRTVMKIKTSSLPLDAPKNPAECPLFQLYAHVASPDATAVLRQRYLAGGLGFKEVKEAFVDLIVTKFAREREDFQHYIASPDLLERILVAGEERAAAIAGETLGDVREALGLGAKGSFC